MIYFLPLILILFGIYYYDYKGNQRNKLFLWVIICALLICIAGFRYRLGQDTVIYLREYKNIPALPDLRSSYISNSRYSPGFILVLSFFKMLSPEFYLFQIFQAAFVNIVFFRFFRQQAKNQFFAALVYYIFIYFLMCFQQIREAFSVCIFLLAWPYFMQRKWLQWYIMSALAFSFHLSAAILFILPIILLPGIRQLFRYGRRTIFICLGVTLVALLLQTMFFKYIELLNLTENITERAQTYERSALGGSTLNIFGIISLIFQYILFPYLAINYLNKEKENLNFEQRYFRTLNDFVLLSIYVGCFSIFINIMGRYLNYFFPFAVVAMSDWVFEPIRVRNKKVRFRFPLWMMLFVPMFYFYSMTYYFGNANKSGTLKNYMAYYPYSSIFDEQKDENREKTMIKIIKNINKRVR